MVLVTKSFDPDHFLKHYWQKKPALIRRAFPGFQDPVTPDELAGLSLEPEVDSRLVMQRGGKKPWQVVHGPQRSAVLRRLPVSHWTLLVQGVDRYVPGVAALLEQFRFIPDWRVEDIMISFAPRGGTVGPHIDSYDVFLLQGKGRRRWCLDSQASSDLIPDLDLRILKHFHARQDWVLETGDMLYLPPGLAHYGTALEECLTYSVGFRAPSSMEMLIAAQERLAKSEQPDIRYSDPDLKRVVNRAEISRTAIVQFRKLLTESLSRLGDQDFNSLIGELLTQQKGATLDEELSVDAATLRSRLRKGWLLSRRPGSRLAYIKRGAAVDFFADGRRYALNGKLAPMAQLLTSRPQFASVTFLSSLRNRDFVRLMTKLVSAGTFQLSKPKHP